jgi:alkyl hydroperoxide reductase subunit AhpC
MTLRLGDTAPDFSAETTHGPIRFHDWIGDSWCVFFSHPADFTPVCTTELGRVGQLGNALSQRNVKALALSVNEVAQHRAWIDDIEETNKTHIAFPLVADTERRISNLYGMIHPRHDSTSTVRTVFLIDPAKKVRMTMTYPMSTGRNFDEILRIIDSLQITDRYHVETPADWTWGDDVIIRPTIDDDAALSMFGTPFRRIKSYLRYITQPGK